MASLKYLVPWMLKSPLTSLLKTMFWVIFFRLSNSLHNILIQKGNTACILGTIKKSIKLKLEELADR